MISVIIPVYNGEKTLEHTLKTLFVQTYQDVEIIVVNDGSTDSTENILNKWSSKIRIINKKNGGVSSARNLGITEAKGEYIAFVDCDDECECNMLEKMYCALQKENAEYVIAGMQKKIQGKGLVYQYEEKIFEGKTIYTNLEYFLKNGLNSPVAKLYEKSVLEEKSIKFDETLPLGEDINFNLEYLLAVRKVVYIKDIVYTYLFDNSVATVTYRENYYEKRLLSIEKMTRTLNKYGLENPWESYLKTKIVYAALFNLQKKQCPLKFKEKLKVVKNIRENYREQNTILNGKMKILKWIINHTNTLTLYVGAILMRKVTEILPENIRGLSI